MAVRKYTLLAICFIVFITGLFGCVDASDTVSHSFVNEAEKVFDKNFSVEEILYDEELEIYDASMVSQEKDIKVWMRGSDTDLEEGKVKVITAVSSELMEYGLELPENNALRNAQTQVLLMARSMKYTGNIAVTSDLYDEKDEKYTVNLITDNSDRLKYEIDMINGSIKLLQ